MKTLRTLLSIFALMAFISGCASSPQAAAYKTLESVSKAEQAAMNIYGEAYRAGNVSPELRAKIRKAHEDYQSAMTAAIELARFDYSAPPSADVLALLNAVLTAIEPLKIR